MKAQVANYQYRVFCLRIVPKAGTTIYLTNHVRNLTMNGHTYLTTSGYDFTGYNAGSTAAPAMVDLEGIAGLAGIGIDQIQSGVFDNAKCHLFAVDYTNPIEDYEPIVASIFGKTHVMDQKYKIEEMSLVDVLGQSVGRTYMTLCQKKLGGQEFAGCKVNIASYTATGTLTGVTNSSLFIASGLAQATDYFKTGTIQFTSGANLGLKPMEIKAFTSGGTIETYEPFYYLPAIGDTFTIIAGCQKRLEDCRDVYNNVVNFGGFSNIPTSSIYTTIGGL